MAFNDTLFQLGMDLTRSSPAHEEDIARVSQSLREDRRTGRGEEGSECSGRTLNLDLIAASKAASQKSIERALVAALTFVRARVLSSALSRDPATGAVEGSIETSLGAIAVEAWPATGYVTLSIAASSGLRPEMAMTAFGGAFGARETIVRRERRPGDGSRWKKAAALPAEAAAPVRLAPRRPALKPQKAQRAA